MGAHHHPERIDALRSKAAEQLAGRVVTVAAHKGGVGKTTLAIELAFLVDGVLVDLDWDQGGASRALGHFHERYVRSALLDAIDADRAPRPKRGHSRPDLVPSSPDLEANQPEPERISAALARWAQEWRRPVVVDTHPGAGPASSGAVGAADIVVVPLTLATRELDAAEGMCSELYGYPLLLVPNRVGPVPPGAMVERLRSIAETYGARVGPLVSHHGWLPTRLLRTAVSALPRPSVRAQRMVDELCDVAEAVISYGQ